MADKRKNNGGNSTKPLKPTDGRLNRAKAFVDEWLEDGANLDELRNVFKKLQDMALNGDIKAMTLYLSYMLGKPTENKNITSNGETINNPIIFFGEQDNTKS